MVAHPHADLALLVSGQVYEDIVRHGYSGPAAPEFQRIRATVKDYEDDAWLWVARSRRSG